MEKRMHCNFTALKDVFQFGENNPPSLDAARAAFAAVGSAIAQIEALASSRLHSTSTFRGASAERQAIRKRLYSAVSDLSRVSKTLDKTAYPDIASQLKLGRLDSYQSLLSFANNAITVATPIQQVFIDRGAPATFLAEIRALITALHAAAGRSMSGMQSQIGKNVLMKIAIREGMEQVRILDGILSIVLKPTPGLLAAWKAAKRVPRAPVRADNDRAPSGVVHPPVRREDPNESPLAPTPPAFTASTITSFDHLRPEPSPMLSSQLPSPSAEFPLNVGS